MKIAHLNLEDHLFSIWGAYFDLTIATEPSIKENMAWPAVYQPAYLRSEVGIRLFTCSVKVTEVYTATDLSFLLLHMNYVSESGWLLDRFDETNIQKLMCFLFDLHLELWPEIPRGLLDQPGSFLDINFMLDQLWI